LSAKSLPLLLQAAKEASRDFADREGIVRHAQDRANKFIEEYFDIDEIERMLIADTIQIIILAFDLRVQSQMCRLLNQAVRAP
jgi:hypothetical protein